MAEAKQLPLAFPHTPHLTEADFLPSPANRQALDFLANGDAWPQRRLVLWGGQGTGKTHLLHIWARNNGAGIVPGPALRRPIWPEGALAVDDVDQVPSEQALLHLLNAAAEAGRKLLLASTVPAGRLCAALPDLQSRLRATAAVEIGRPDDDFLASLLRRLLSDRQLTVAPAVQAWVLTRLPRSPGAIRDAVARLDDAALAAGAPVTRLLAGRALADLMGDDLAMPPA